MTERFFKHPNRALVAGAVLLAVVGLMALLIPSGPLAIDRSWSDAMHDSFTHGLEDVALVFNWLGRGLGRTLTLAGVGIALLAMRRWLALFAFAVTEALEALLSFTLKALVDRPRPPDALIHPTGSSFPSGHVTYGAATCIALVLLFSAPGPRRRWWWALAALGIAGMAWSRTFLHVHWLSDVVAGVLLGTGVSLLVFGAAQRWGPAGGSGAGGRSTP